MNTPIIRLQRLSSPVGADSILDILNEEPGWKGRFEDAFYALNHALAQVQMEKSAEAMLKEHYGEGKPI